MSESNIETVVANLKGEEDRIKCEIAELKKREQELNRELKRIQAGISGLTGKGRQKRGSAGAKSQKEAENVVDMSVEECQT